MIVSIINKIKVKEHMNKKRYIKPEIEELLVAGAVLLQGSNKVSDEQFSPKFENFTEYEEED